MSSERTKASDQSDYSDILKVLKKPHFEKGLALERQIASHLRDLIQQKKIATRTRLPPILVLAEIWGTNYYTVRAALHRLAGEGLLVQSPKLGSFVAPNEASFRRACIYHDRPLSFQAEKEFFSRLNISLYHLLSERGILTTSYFDQRTGAKRKELPPEILDLVKDRRIDALIGSSIGLENPEWLRQLNLPVASLTMSQGRGTVSLDYKGFMRMAVEEAAKAGRRRIGLIYRAVFPEVGQPGAVDLRAELEKAARERGIEVVVPEGTADARRLSILEEGGRRLCEELLSRPERPDALVVFPDNYARGVIYSLLQHHVRLPDEMMLISHRNAETQIFTHFPVVWLTVKIEDFAKGLLKQIDCQMTGKKPKPILVKVSVEKGNSESE